MSMNTAQINVIVDEMFIFIAICLTDATREQNDCHVLPPHFCHFGSFALIFYPRIFLIFWNCSSLFTHVTMICRAICVSSIMWASCRILFFVNTFINLIIKLICCRRSFSGTCCKCFFAVLRKTIFKNRQYYYPLFGQRLLWSSSVNLGEINLLKVHQWIFFLNISFAFPMNHRFNTWVFAEAAP